MDIATAKSTPKDVFMHLFAIVMLYITAGSFLRLVFSLINTTFPDQLSYNFDAGSAMRWALAALIVVFPFYIWASRSIERDIKTHHEKAELKVRKWLIYFTLFASAGFIIGDLISLIFNFLEGELSIRFILKVVSIGVVAGIIFWYYLGNLRKNPGSSSTKEKGIAWVSIVLVVVAVVIGFVNAGSPLRQRLTKFDETRIADLQTIQWQIVNFWQQKEKLPETLEDLRDSISGFVAPTDPETGEKYTYTPADVLAFELCAVFNLPSGDTYPKEEYLRVPTGVIGVPEDNWNHEAGEVCFDRAIDPDLYKIR